MILRTLFGITAMMMTSTAALAEMTPAEREAFRAEVRAFLLEEPEVLVEAMEVLQGKQEQNAAQRDLAMLRDNADLIYRDPNSWAGGNLEADLTIVEFVDYRCGYCRKAHDEVAELVKSDGNIRLVLKEFPILGEQSMLSSQFAIALRQLHGDDAYKAAHDALIAFRGEISPETLTRLASDLGHDPSPIIERMAAPEVQSVIDVNHALGSMMEINGTPTFVIDETMVRGYVPLQGMRQIVAGQREG
ncbi:MAG: DsbA family protein [Pseudotabrizicola sp.]|uniref:DsbA family protein n=1 Tax=Pseudotabrizicola sp. TaxID=2939647 RepID=UPI0027219770|nr:DsbA family protein [Pseudotabrizicola sp.]MDO8882933.1 DsbA family protein [Pseudotabrizicola sp.]MDP2082754.1 DsbA family protein [Pseudotabrizicola sp.]MDZ7576273.1 DsbA family protein [Pseudotabrizicola sp.]